MSDALDFWSQAASQTSPGDLIDTKGMSTDPDWRHGQALAARLGFVPVEGSTSVYVNRRTPQSLTLRWVELGDFEMWLKLFKTCFGHEITQAHWAWKYRAAARPGVGVLLGDRLVAFYGGMPRTVASHGKLHHGIQIGDVMVDPEFRGLLGRRGPFQMAASTFLEQMLSVGSPYHLGFGFPNERAMRVAQRLHLYRAVDEILELSWPATGLHKAPFFSRFEETAADDAWKSADALWHDMKGPLASALVGVRDSRYLKQRYLEHPTNRYIWLQSKSRITGKVLAMGLCKPQPDGRLEVLDLLGHPARFADTIAGICSYAKSLNIDEVFMWMTRSQSARLEKTTPRHRHMQVWVPSNDWVPSNFESEIDNRWWLTGGDTDFR